MQKGLAGFVLTALVAVLELPACGSDHPGVINAIGAPCRNDLDCGGIFCVDTGGGTCQISCRGDLDCGPGYACRTQNRTGTDGKVQVCIVH